MLEREGTNMPQFHVDHRNEILRVPNRASYDKRTIYEIIDEALFCHVGISQGGQPVIIPTLHARIGNNIIIHGSKESRLIQHIQTGEEICIAITLLDGLVLARSAYHSSVNYRSVVLFGRGVAINEEKEKLAALKALTEQNLRGRWKDVRKPKQEELDATAVVSIPIEVASAKIRKGPPVDDIEDHELPIWAGVVPLELKALKPEEDPRLWSGIPVPEYVTNLQKS
jgi:nitroimidazol reductase NimA-like FMN-containing flavoprotein (pyridoxamine 5'-phosphate oxidase superfamily)